MRRSHAKELDLPVLILESTDLNESVPLERFPALSMFLQFALLAEFLFNHEACLVDGSDYFVGFIVVEPEDSVVMVGGLPLDGALAQTKEVAAVGEGSQEKILVFYCEDS